MNCLKRLIWCALLFGIQGLYFPLNRFLKGGMELKTFLDDYIPLLPIWVVPYGLICVWWVLISGRRGPWRNDYMKRFSSPLLLCAFQG